MGPYPKEIYKLAMTNSIVNKCIRRWPDDPGEGMIHMVQYLAADADAKFDLLLRVQKNLSLPTVLYIKSDKDEKD